MKGFRRLINYISLGLIAAAVYKELNKSPEERTWHGKLFEFIPYDFRPPTVERIVKAYWNPDDRRIFTETVFGVGWAINLHSLLSKLRELQKTAT